MRNVTYSSCLTDWDGNLAVDTSLVINVCASSFAPAALSAIPSDTYMTEDVAKEMRAGYGKDHAGLAMFEKLLNMNLLEVKNLELRGMEIFSELVSGEARRTLGDGEASTIALAVENGYVAMLDDRKALTFCENKFPGVLRASTIDVFSHPAVREKLGSANVGDMVFSALKNARMRVLPNQLDWVVQIIGAERVKDCSSLPIAVRRKASCDFWNPE